MPLTFDSFQAFFKGFNELEYRCPPSQHMTDHDLSQLVGTLFIKDSKQRKNWSNHINQPEIINGAGARVGGPPPLSSNSNSSVRKSCVRSVSSPT